MDKTTCFICDKEILKINARTYVGYKDKEFEVCSYNCYREVAIHELARALGIDTFRNNNAQIKLVKIYKLIDQWELDPFKGNTVDLILEIKKILRSDE